MMVAYPNERAPVPPQLPVDVARKVEDLSKKIDKCCADMMEMQARIRAMHRSIAGRYVSAAEVISYGNDDYAAPVVASTLQLKSAVVDPAGYTPPTL